VARKARRNSNPLAGLEKELEKLRKLVTPAIPIFREAWSELTRDVLRDAFVCHVAGGLLGNANLVRRGNYDNRELAVEAFAQEFAKDAYRIADALMAERDRRAAEAFGSIPTPPGPFVCGTGARRG